MNHHDGPAVIQFHQVLDTFARVDRAFRQVAGTGADDSTDEGSPPRARHQARACAAEDAATNGSRVRRLAADINDPR